MLIQILKKKTLIPLTDYNIGSNESQKIKLRLMAGPWNSHKVLVVLFLPVILQVRSNIGRCAKSEITSLDLFCLIAFSREP